jgi:hypothetical protein
VPVTGKLGVTVTLPVLLRENSSVSDRDGVKVLRLNVFFVLLSDNSSENDLEVLSVGVMLRVGLQPREVEVVTDRESVWDAVSDIVDENEKEKDGDKEIVAFVVVTDTDGEAVSLDRDLVPRERDLVIEKLPLNLDAVELEERLKVLVVDGVHRLTLGVDDRVGDSPVERDLVGVVLRSSEKLLLRVAFVKELVRVRLTSSVSEEEKEKLAVFLDLDRREKELVLLSVFSSVGLPLVIEMELDGVLGENVPVLVHLVLLRVLLPPEREWEAVSSSLKLWVCRETDLERLSVLVTSSVNVKERLELRESEAEPMVGLFERLRVSARVRDRVGENLVRVSGGVAVRWKVVVRVGVLPDLVSVGSSEREWLGVSERPDRDCEKLLDRDFVMVSSSV